MQQLAGQSDSLDLSLLANEPLQDLETVDLEPVEDDLIISDSAETTTTKTDNVADAEIVTLEPIEEQPEDKKAEPDEPAASKDKDAAKATPANSNEPDSSKPQPPASPYNQANLDADQDGVIDHRPDDPGIGEEKPKKEGWLF